MKPEDIARAYNKITRLWEHDSFDISNGIEQHKRAIAFVNNRGRALDVGCGCSDRIINLLLENGFSPEGIDVSGEMIRLAKQRHPELAFYHGSICDWELTGKYDFISAWDSIWHVPLDQHEAVLEKLFAALNSGGVCIFSCGGTDEPSQHTDDSMGPEVYYSTLGISGFLNVISNAQCVCRHFEFDQYPELHSYFIVQKA